MPRGNTSERVSFEGNRTTCRSAGGRPRFSRPSRRVPVRRAGNRTALPLTGVRPRVCVRRQGVPMSPGHASGSTPDSRPTWLARDRAPGRALLPRWARARHPDPDHGHGLRPAPAVQGAPPQRHPGVEPRPQLPLGRHPRTRPARPQGPAGPGRRRVLRGAGVRGHRPAADRERRTGHVSGRRRVPRRPAPRWAARPRASRPPPARHRADLAWSDRWSPRRGARRR